MKRNKLSILLGLMVMLLAILACGGSVTTAHVAESWMATDIEGNNRTTIFSPEDDFFAFVDLQNAPDDTQLKAIWTAVAVTGEEPNLVLNETEFTSGSDTVYFQLFNDQLWPAGTYQVDIYINDQVATTMSFEVR
jgi:hypothetical protein